MKKIFKNKNLLVFPIIGVIIGSFMLCYVIRSTSLYVAHLHTLDIFKDEYIQIIYPTSIKDYTTAKAILAEADEAFSTITDYETAEETFGDLWRYCITNEGSVSEYHEIKLVSASFDDKYGYIWIEFVQYGYDKNGEITYGAGSTITNQYILSKWNLEKINDKWVVTDIIEHP